MPTRVTSVRSIDSVAGFGSSPAFGENPGSLFCDSIALPCIGLCSCGRHRSAIRAVQQRAGRSCHLPNVYESTRIRYTRTQSVRFGRNGHPAPTLHAIYIRFTRIVQAEYGKHTLLDRFGRNGQTVQDYDTFNVRFCRIGHPNHSFHATVVRFCRIGHLRCTHG